LIIQQFLRVIIVDFQENNLNKFFGCKKGIHFIKQPSILPIKFILKKMKKFVEKLSVS
jgi:hypothetical protein